MPPNVTGDMGREVKLSRVDSVLEGLTYPISRSDAASQLAGTTVRLADGTVDLGELIDETGSETYDSVDDLGSELFNVLPVEAVGEPGQSEGEG